MPLTLVIVLIFFSYVTFQINQYMIEKEIYAEERNQFTHDRLIQMAIIDSKEILIGNTSDFSGTFTYASGEVNVTITTITDDIKRIVLTSEIYTSVPQKNVTYYYYENEETVLPWLEEN